MPQPARAARWQRRAAYSVVTVVVNASSRSAGESGLKSFGNDLQRFRSALAATLGLCTVLAMPQVAVADDDSTLQALDHAQMAMFNASIEAGEAVPDQKFPINTKANFYSQNTIKVCAPDLEDRQRRPDLPPIDSQTWLSMNPDKVRCIVHALQEDTALFKRFATEARAGGVSPETLKALALPVPATSQSGKRAAPPAVAADVNPWNGTGATLDHSADGVFLSYADSGGAHHRYAVARPKMLQGMATGDTGSWAYVAPDKSSGRMFQVGTGGNVQSSALNAMQIKLFLGQ
jgi:hypothetical protein